MDGVPFCLLHNCGDHDSNFSTRDAQRISLAQQNFLVFEHERHRHVSDDCPVQHEIN